MCVWFWGNILDTSPFNQLWPAPVLNNTPVQYDTDYLLGAEDKASPLFGQSQIFYYLRRAKDREKAKDNIKLVNLDPDLGL